MTTTDWKIPRQIRSGGWSKACCKSCFDAFYSKCMLYDTRATPNHGALVVEILFCTLASGQDDWNDTFWGYDRGFKEEKKRTYTRSLAGSIGTMRQGEQ